MDIFFPATHLAKSCLRSTLCKVMDSADLVLSLDFVLDVPYGFNLMVGLSGNNVTYASG